MTTNSASYLTELHQLINQHFNLVEIQMLCLDLHVDYESVAGEEKPSRIRELLLGLGRNGRLPELITLAQRQRPLVEWRPVPDDFEMPESLAFGSLDVHQDSSFTLGSAPPPPRLFVGREKEIAELQQHLTGATDTTLLTAVRGWPGIGKTSLAAALAHNDQIKSQFPLILWTALGQNPSVDVELGNWITALRGDPRDIPTTEMRSSRLAAILRHKKVLLIIDDVWDPAHVQPFLVGGKDCRTLITTREPEIARALGLPDKAIYKLLVLSEMESLQLLEQLAPVAVQQDPEGMRRLALELEGLPLALHVAGRLLATEASLGWGVTDLLNELGEGTRLLQEKAPADRTYLATQTTPTIAALFENSTNRLDPTTRDRFALLGVFVSKPATFDAPAIAAAWDIENPRSTLRTLVNRGLIEPTAEGRFQIHALLAVHAKSMWESIQ